MQINKISKTYIFILFLFMISIVVGVYLFFSSNNAIILSEAEIKIAKPSNINTNYFYDFETLDGLVNTENIIVAKSHSGKMSCNLIGGKEYGPSVNLKISEISEIPIKKVAASVWVYPISNSPIAVLTLSVINSNNTSVFWDGKSTENQNFTPNKWTKINALFNLPADKISADDIISINIWNKGKTDIIIDDLEIVYGESTERRGVYTDADPSNLLKRDLNFHRKTAAFNTIYFDNININNENSTRLTINKDDFMADFSPNDEVYVGNFITDKSNLDEIICINKEKIAMFEYDTEDHGFNKLWESTLGEQSFLKQQSAKFVGDFNADGKIDFLLVDKNTGAWDLYNFNNKAFKVIIKGNNKLSSKWFDALNKPFVANSFFNNKKDGLAILNTNYYMGVQLNNVRNTFEEIKLILPSSDSSLFTNSSSVFIGNFDNVIGQDILKLNTDWRFDFKMMKLDPAGFYIFKALDFKAFLFDFNPKYFEFVKIVSGNITSLTKSSLLVMMCNCADSKFNGIYCNEFQNVAYLPNSTALYELVNNNSN